MDWILLCAPQWMRRPLLSKHLQFNKWQRWDSNQVCLSAEPFPPTGLVSDVNITQVLKLSDPLQSPPQLFWAISRVPGMEPRASPVSSWARTPCQALSPFCWLLLPCWAVFSAKGKTASPPPSSGRAQAPAVTRHFSENLSLIVPMQPPCSPQVGCESPAALD